MKYYLNDEEVTLEQLKWWQENLLGCEIIVLEEIKDNEMRFGIFEEADTTLCDLEEE